MMRDEFKVHKLNGEGMKKAEGLAEGFSEFLDRVEQVCGKDGREMAIVRTKLQEASFQAKRAIAQRPENQRGDTRIVKSFDDADRFVDKLLTGTADEFCVPVAIARRMGGLLKDLLAEVRK